MYLSRWSIIVRIICFFACFFPSVEVARLKQTDYKIDKKYLKHRWDNVLIRRKYWEREQEAEESTGFHNNFCNVPEASAIHLGVGNVFFLHIWKIGSNSAHWLLLHLNGKEMAENHLINSCKKASKDM